MPLLGRLPVSGSGYPGSNSSLPSKKPGVVGHQILSCVFTEDGKVFDFRVDASRTYGKMKMFGLR